MNYNVTNTYLTKNHKKSTKSISTSTTSLKQICTNCEEKKTDSKLNHIEKINNLIKNNRKKIRNSKENNKVSKNIISTSDDNNVSKNIISTSDDNNVSKNIISTSDDNCRSKCIYSTSDNNYAPKCIVALTTFKKYNNEYDCFIIGTSFDNYVHELCDMYDIKLIEVDLTNDFYEIPQIEKRSKYPVECFYVFYGPKIFKQMGYEYSLYIDGDIYCNKKFDIEHTEKLAAIKLYPMKQFTSIKKDWDVIRKVWKLPDEVLMYKRTNSYI